MTHFTLKQKIGQLFILGFSGDTITADHPIAKDISSCSLGGVILFDRLLAHNKKSNNIIDTEQLSTLTRSLQELAEIPLLVAVDQEGGEVSRFTDNRGFPSSPSAQELGSEPDTSATVHYARQTAEMLREVGVNFNLAPVVDLNIYPDNPIIGKHKRSFSDHAATVSEHAKAWIAEHRKANILTCLKHFPGHGNSHADSHLGFVDVTETWKEIELEPFRRLIEQNGADTVMTGHLFNKNFDTNYPATLSHKTLNTLLFRELQYQGPVISDDMQMKAITNHYGLPQACCLAINAGVDLVIIGNNIDYNPDIFTTLINTVEKAVEKGTIKEKRIEEAFTKTQQLKTKTRL